MFRDINGRDWTVEIDAYILGELRDAAKVDLADDGLHKIEQDEVLLVRALTVMCREQIDAQKLTSQQFAKLVVREVLDNARTAVGGAAEDFFPPKRWSDLEYRLSQLRDAEESYAQLRPMLAMLNRPDMPAAMREAVMAAISKQIQAVASIASENSEGSTSASGQDATPESAASDLQDSSESIHAA